jgi:uncharacterized membrane protein
MNRQTVALAAAAAVLASGCSRPDGQNLSNNAAPAADGTNAGGSPPRADGSGWDLQSSGEGVALALVTASGDTAVRLFCPAGKNQLLVNVPSFRPVGSEERLSFGSGGNVVALVANTRGDAQRGGVSGTGSVPDSLAALVGGPIAVNYGAQNSGPHPAPPAQEARAFAAACRDGVAPATGGTNPTSTPTPAPTPAPAAPQTAGACRSQDGKPVPANRLKAVGTEPFWAARIDGRCVTYLHPENQAGTRIWAQFSGSASSGVWTGFYENQRFTLRTRPAPGCSDGMSDRRYPIEVSLTIGTDKRTGCAEPL